MTSLEEYADKIHDNIKKKEKDDIILDTIMKNTLKGRVEISNHYKRKYGVSLFEEINKSVGGDFGECASQLFLSPLEFCMHHLQIGLKNGDEVVMEQLTSRSIEDLNTIEKEFNRITGKDLKTELTNKFKGAVGKNLCNLWNTKRVENHNPDQRDCENYANTLINNKPKEWVENEDIFKEIFIQRSPEELILIARYYLKNTGKNLIDDIDNKVAGKNQTLLKEILYNNIMPHEIFADKMKKAVKGLGTDEYSLSRALVSRCDLDMNYIRDMYQTKYKVSLKEDIIDDTSGSYQKLCVYLCEK